jgi:ATP dependent DNA ligase domain
VLSCDMPKRSGSPQFIPPQLSQLVKVPPEGDGCAHELKYDGYRIHAHIAGRDVRLLTRTGLDWTDRYQTTAKALAGIGLRATYLDGEPRITRFGSPLILSRVYWVKPELVCDRVERKSHPATCGGPERLSATSPAKTLLTPTGRPGSEGPAAPWTADGHRPPSRSRTPGPPYPKPADATASATD